MKRYSLQMQRDDEGDVMGVLVESEGGNWCRHDEVAELEEDRHPRDNVLECTNCGIMTTNYVDFGSKDLSKLGITGAVCSECIWGGLEELDKWRECVLAARTVRPHPFDCLGCPDCQGIKKAGPLA